MAIFKRRKPRRTVRTIREALWPSMGWRRTLAYYRHRVFRTGDSTYKIAAGLATGAAVSWSPFLGTHFAQAILFSWLLRANLVAGFVGTAWGNPTTFPFLFLVDYAVGVKICALFGMEDFAVLPAGADFALFMTHPWNFIGHLLSHPLNLLLPLTVGGYLCALLFWPLAYGLLYYPVRAARRAYRRKRLRRRKRDRA